MPKVAYSQQERERIRHRLLSTALELMARQGVQHTTVEQVYKAVGISRTFFYSFFPAKEDLVLEALYLQQPKLLEYVRRLVEDPALSWREAARQFFESCCYGEKSGITVLTVEEQQLIFRHLPPEKDRLFRQKQFLLFEEILKVFGIRASREQIALFINLSLTVIVFRKAIPETLPFFVPEAARETMELQIKTILDYMETLGANNQAPQLPGESV